jgi:hypothetical protein
LQGNENQEGKHPKNEKGRTLLDDRNTKREKEDENKNVEMNRNATEDDRRGEPMSLHGNAIFRRVIPSSTFLVSCGRRWAKRATC